MYCGRELHIARRPLYSFLIRWTLFGLNRIIDILHLHKELLNEKVRSHTAN
jgi:hypothetical protein